MIRDLQLASDASLTCESDVCIVGAGTAGLYLARLLRKRGLQVILLEAGDSVARSPSEMRQHCEQRGIVYSGAEAGRSFGLGGTSVLWGGQMIPMVESDFGARPHAGIKAWPLTYGEIAPFFSVVRRDLGLSSGGWLAGAAPDTALLRDFPDLCGYSPNFNVRLSEWLPFKKRNFAISFADLLPRDDGLTIWLNANVTSVTRSAKSGFGRIESVIAISANRRTLQVRAKVIVICAGALESTRLLLEFDAASQGSITSEGAPLGRFFADHLSVTCGRFTCMDWRRYNLAVAPMFSNGIMRTPRLELSATAQEAMNVPSAFAHMTFVTRGNTGFDFLRSILRRRQGEQQRLNLAPNTLGRALVDFCSMAYWRSVHGRLWIPRSADLLVQIDIEQTPNPDSRLYLSSERDSFDRKRLIIDWRITRSDVRTIRRVAELVVAGWQKSPLRSAADLRPTLPEEFDSFASLYDVYHPTGSIRMGDSLANSVVNKDLRLWKTPNCYVSTTAVFPSAGSANPGMTHLALTARLAEKVVHEVNA